MMDATSSPANQDHRRVRVLIVDDAPQVRRDLRQMLELTGLIDVVAEGANGQDAIQLAVEASPDVVIMDLEMPGMNGFEATRQIKEQGSAPRVIILSVHAEREDIARAQAVGADDFVVKGANFQVLIQAILMKTGSPNSSDI